MLQTEVGFFVPFGWSSHVVIQIKHLDKEGKITEIITGTAVSFSI